MLLGIIVSCIKCPSVPCRHLLLAESQADAYAGSSFPGLVDLLFEIDKAEDVDARWERVKRHFSVIVYTIDAAAATLRDVIKFIPKTVDEKNM